MSPTYARNQISVSDASYGAALTFDFDQSSRKLTLDIRTASVFLQTRELLHSGYGGTDEQLLRPGFHSRTFVTPVYGLRLRAASATAAEVTFVFYA